MQIRLLTDRAQPVIYQDGKRYLQFAGTSYLGMGNLPEFERLIHEGLNRHGANHGSSRNSNVQLGVFDVFEAFFAAGAGAEDACLLSSGFLAGHLAIQSLKPKVDLLWIAPDAHPAILPEGKAGDPAQSYETWVEACKQKASSLMGHRIGILANAVNPLIPKIHDFEWVRDLPPVNQYYLLIDDSHAFGVVGESLFGTYRQWSQLPVNLCICGSLGKALCLPAGIVVGNADWIDMIRQHAIYRSSSPPAPAFLQAFMQGQALYLRQKELLAKKVSALAAGIAELPAFYTADGYPVISFASPAWVEALASRALVVSSFPYPGPQDAPVNRIVLSAGHTDEDLNYLMACMVELQAGR
ncbi:aminotransferase class I/II-fold pyridoxal phosphate-dependent enzyme [Lunatimonas salinarum]|uniref:aminotransferase class I/II-fold pyridoxal phosphate-dependent enzyme n=1 Tax=Lunatimonas salinarum TaxID=1774590 RepID=UPI001ADF7DBA|nr:aminotransferase class I/II-fold pyridoxal phosphate-dependent enzyme [Lunatimonas salinarum]